MNNWFNVLYTLRSNKNSSDPFLSYKDVQETAGVAKQLDEATYTNDSPEEKNKKRLPILQDYFMKHLKLNLYYVRDMLRQSIESCSQINPANIDRLYQALEQFKFDSNHLQAYATNLGYIRKYGSEFLDKSTRSYENQPNPVKENIVAAIGKKIDEVLNKNDKDIQGLVEIYYMLITSENDKVETYIDKAKLLKDSKGIFDEPQIALKILKVMTDVNVFRNDNLLKLIDVLKSSSISTDEEFITGLNSFNADVLQYDKNTLDGYKQQIVDSYKENTDFCRFVYDKLNAVAVLQNNPETKSVYAALSKTKRKRTLFEVLDLITAILESDKVVEPGVVNTTPNDPNNIEEVLKKVMSCIKDEIIIPYMARLKAFVDSINLYINTLNVNPVPLASNGGSNPKYTLKSVLQRWKTFIDSPLCTGSPDESAYLYEWNQVRDDVCVNKDYKFVPLDKLGQQGGEEDIFPNNPEFDMLSMLREINYKGTIDELFNSLVDSKIVTLNQKAFKVLDPYLKVVAVNGIFQYLINFFSNPYNTQVTFKRGNQKVPFGWYYVACNLIYRRDYAVNESANFIMYKGKYIITEAENDVTATYFSNVAKELKQKFPNLEKAKDEEERLEIMSDYIDKVAQYDDKRQQQEENEKSKEDEINNSNSTIDSSLATATAEVKAAAQNVAKTAKPNDVEYLNKIIGEED